MSKFIKILVIQFKILINFGFSGQNDQNCGFSGHNDQNIGFAVQNFSKFWIFRLK